MDSLADTAKVLRAARTLVDLRQDELAKRAGVSRNMVARIEEARKGVPFDAVGKVRAALEKEGVVFLPSTDSRGEAPALRKPT